MGNTNIKLHINALLSVLLLYVVVYDFSNTVEYRTREQINRSYTWYTRPYEHNTRISSAVFGVWMNMPASLISICNMYSKHNVLSVLYRKKILNKLKIRSPPWTPASDVYYAVVLFCLYTMRTLHTQQTINDTVCMATTSKPYMQTIVQPLSHSTSLSQSLPCSVSISLSFLGFLVQHSSI